LIDEWFPNLFGSQRFGIQFQNINIAKDFLDGNLQIKEKFEAKFKLQSYSSRLFNEYVISITKKWLTMLDGEIVEIDNQDNSVSVWYYESKTNSIQLFKDQYSDKDFFHYPAHLGETLPLTDDLDIHITGPILWFDLLLPLAARQAGQKEKHLFDSNWLSPKKLQLYKHIGIYGIRRRMRTRAKQAKFHFDRDDVCIQFTLDSGVYASIFIDKLLKSLRF
jgi:tRNA(Glu) U13 pseudouridine synthase TruD